MLNTKRFIIAEVNGHLKHFKGDTTHYTLTVRNGLTEADVIEKGLFIDSFAQVLDCKDARHYQRRSNQLFNYSDSIRNNASYTVFKRDQLQGD